MPDRTIQLVDLGAVYADLRAEIDAAIRRVCESSAFIGGGPVQSFETAFATYTGAKHCIGVANGTDALQLVLMAADLPAGSAVVVPANTFIATAEAVHAAGLTCRFADVTPDTGLLDLDALPDVVDDDVSAIIPVHLYGRMVDMQALTRFAAERGLFVLEDTAQAHGAHRGDGRQAGTVGHAGTYSFYPGKNLGAFGDAGAIVTDDDGLAERITVIRDHGRLGKYDHAVIGVNSRLDGLQAAILEVKLAHLDRWTAERRRVAEVYRRELDAALPDFPGFEDLPEAEVHHLFPVLVDDREALAAELREHGVLTGVHYGITVPGTTAFGSQTGAFPVAEHRAAHQLSLPMHPYLSDEDAAWVAGLVNDHVGARV